MAGNFDPWLMTLAGVIALVASYVIFSLANHVRMAPQRRPGHLHLVTLGGGVTVGTAFLAIHFLNMLATRSSSWSFDFSAIALSLGFSVATAWLIFYAICAPSVNRRVLLFYSLAAAFSLLGVHVMGIAAVHVVTSLNLDLPWFAAMVPATVLLTLTTMVLARELGSRMSFRANLLRTVAAAVCGLGLFSHHYLVVSSIRWGEGPRTVVREFSHFNASEIAVFIGIASIVLLLSIVVLSARQCGRGFSIKSKIAVLAIALVVGTAGAIGIVFYSYSNRLLVEKELQNLVQETHIAAAELQTHLQILKTDVLFLAQTSAVRGFIRAQKITDRSSSSQEVLDLWQDRLLRIFREFVMTKPQYGRISLITLTGGNQQTLSYRRGDDRITDSGDIPAPEKTFFARALSLDKGAIIFSDTVIDQDSKGVFSAMMYAATPVYWQDTSPAGVLLLSIDLSHILERMSAGHQGADVIFFTDERGAVIFKQEKPRTISLNININEPIQYRFPELLRVYRSPSTKERYTIQFETGAGRIAVHMKKLFFDQQRLQRYLLVAHGAWYEGIANRGATVLNRFAVITIVLLGAAIVIALFFSRIITEPISSITRATQKFARGETDVRLPESATDEVGTLARNLKEMITQVHERGEALKKSEAFVQVIVDNAADGIITIDADGRIRSFNLAAELMFGYKAEEVLGRELAVLIPEPYRSQHQTFVYQYLSAASARPEGLIRRRRELPAVRRNGEVFTTEISVSVVPNDDELLFVGTVHDVTDRKQAEEKLRLVAKVMDSSLEAIIIADAGRRIQTVNPAFTLITGFTEEEAIGQNPFFTQAERDDEEFRQKIWKSVETEGNWRGEIWHRHKDGRLFPSWLGISLIKGSYGQVTNYVALFSDITDRKMAEEKLERLAHYDPLTDLPNRFLFQDRLHQALEFARRYSQQVALLFVDLDRFKVINDTLGHDVGDLLLVEVGKRLKRSVREVDTVARLGGDEFTVILNNITDPKDSENVAAQLLSTITRPFRIKGHECYVGASIGIALFPRDGEDPKTLFKHADIAMYRVKERGKNGYQQYEKAMGQAMTKWHTTETRLRQALKRDEFKLHYQPQISLETFEITGIEALIRWEDDDGELRLPQDFIPVAEDTGLITPIGHWVLHNACAQNKVWQNFNLPKVRVSVNLSGHQLLRRGFLKGVEKALAETGLDPCWLELELTETTLMEYPEEVMPVIAALDEMGVKMSIDDFGTGYSSFSRIKQLPVDTLKIDRSFICDIPHDGDDAAIVRAIIAMAHSLNLKVIAEGVEVSDQLEFLSELHCDAIQGYLVSKPMPPNKLISLLREQKFVDRFRQMEAAFNS